MRACWLAMVLFAGVAAEEAPVGDLTLVGNLAPEFHQVAPLSIKHGGQVTLRFVNVTGGPCGLAAISAPPPEFSAAIWTLTGKPGVPDSALGPEIGEMLHDQLDRIVNSRNWSRWKPVRGRERLDPVWRELKALGRSRDPLALMPHEGYATLLVFLPDWLAEPDRLKVKAMRRLGLQAGPTFDLVVPTKDTDSVRPGKPIIWGERTPNCIPPKLRAISVTMADQEMSFADPLAGPGPAVLHLEADSALTKGGDFDLSYLVGNLAMTPLWVSQNTCTPAAITWTLLYKEQVVAQGDGQAHADLVQLMPHRDPYPLLPGEFLAWKMTLPSSALSGVRKGYQYVLKVRLDASLSNGTTTGGQPLALAEATLALHAD